MRLISLRNPFRFVPVDVEEDDRQRFDPIDPGGRVDIAIGDERIEMVG
jgi:hypothetical protein